MHIWSKLDHVNVVKLLGYIVEDGYPSIVLSWAPNGTVDQYVKGYPECDRVELVSPFSQY